MLFKILKTLRVSLAIVFLALSFIIFLDISSNLSTLLIGYVTYTQFVPSLIGFINSIGWAFAGFILILILTFLFGRIYCSFFCPLGILQDVLIFFQRKFSRKKTFKYRKPENIVRYGILILSLVVLFGGSAIIFSFLDPYSLFGKINTMLFKPVLALGNNLLSRILSSFDIYSLYPVEIRTIKIPAFIFSLVFFIFLVWLTLKFSRLYCNLICPVGTLLGIPSAISLFRISLDKNQCTNCGLCSAVCKAGCIDVLNKKVDHTRCVVCFNCLSSCLQNGVRYSIRKQQKTFPRADSDGNGRRKFLGISAALLSSFFLVDNTLFAQRRRRQGQNKPPVPVNRQHPTAPPGSVNINHFNNLCTSCYLCVSACPTQVLQPSLLTYGLNGILQPHMDYKTSFCNFDCTRCGEVCPTGAILPLSIEEKKITQIGIAKFIQRNCIVITDGTDCGACSEHCPTKAVDMRPHKNGLLLPHVTEELCVGCGACEYACPTDPKSIYVEGNPVHEKAEKPVVEEIKAESSDDFPF